MLNLLSRIQLEGEGRVFVVKDTGVGHRACRQGYKRRAVFVVRDTGGGQGLSSRIQEGGGLSSRKQDEGACRQ